jgi:hypothetical protein
MGGIFDMLDQLAKVLHEMAILFGLLINETEHKNMMMSADYLISCTNFQDSKDEFFCKRPKPHIY